VRDEIEMIVQVNGKKRGQISVAVDCAQETVESAALALDNVQRALKGKVVVKIVVVPRRLINVVVR
jgi:leucyl-tRNA synthetase